MSTLAPPTQTTRSKPDNRLFVPGPVDVRPEVLGGAGGADDRPPLARI